MRVVSGDDEDIISINGDDPSPRELVDAAHSRLPIQIDRLSAGVTTLALLDPVAHLIEDLRIFASSLTDLSHVQRMHRLRRLTIDDQILTPPVSSMALRRLQAFRGSLSVMPDLFALPALVEADVTLHAPNEEAGSSTVTTLNVYSRRGSLEQIVHPEVVRQLGFAGPAKLDLLNAENFARIEQLSIAHVGMLTNAQELLDLPELRTLYLTDVRNVEDVEGLFDAPFEVIALRSLSKVWRTRCTAISNFTILT